MKREERYIVIKISDIDHAIDENLLAQDDYWILRDILEAVRKARRQRNKNELECVVVESDWPEYEIVWKMIEDRVDAKENSPTQDRYAEGYADASRAFVDKGFSLLRGIDSYCTGWNTYMWSTKNES